MQDRIHLSSRPLISIIVPTYNSSVFLPNLRESLLNQTYLNWQCIFIDNASTDGTKEIILSYCAEDSRFSYISKPHDSNPTHSRNLGILASVGEYIAFCDSDDFWHPQKLMAQMMVMKSDIAFVFTDRQIWTHKHLPESFPEFKEFPSALVSGHDVLYSQNLITNSSTLISRTLLRETGLLDETLIGVDDYHLYLRLSLKGKIAKINLPLTYYYVHEGNLSRNKSLMARNLYKLACTVKKENFPSYIQNSLFAQAFKSMALVNLNKSPFHASTLLLRAIFFWICYRLQRIFNSSI